MKSMKKILCLVLALLMAFALVACANDKPEESKAPAASSAPTKAPSGDEGGEGGEEADSKSGGVLTFGVTTDMLWTQPWSTIAPTTFLFSNFVFDSLLIAEKDGSYTCNLLESYSSDKAAKTYTFTLKEGIKFHDGTALDAEAMKWNFENCKVNGVKGKTWFGKVESFEVVDDLTVVMHLTEWDSGILYGLTREGGYMGSPTFYQGHETDEAWLTQNVCGTGPFKFVEWVTGEKVVCERFDEYWKGTPYLDGVQYVIYSDSLSVQAALEAGEVDVWYGADTALYDALNSNDDLSVFTAVTPELGGTMYVLGFNSNDPADPLYDIRVRQAVCYALDKDTINDLLYNGLNTPVNQYALPGSAYYSDDIVGYEYNPEKAKELLAEAGYADGFDMPITYNMINYTDLFTLIQGQLAEVGINAISNGVENAQASELLYDWGTGAYIHGTSAPFTMIAQLTSMFYSPATNRMGYGNFAITPEIDAICEKVMSAANDEEGAAGVRDLQYAIIDTECLWAPVVLGEDFCCRSNGIAIDGKDDWCYFENDLHLIYFVD